MSDYTHITGSGSTSTRITPSGHKDARATRTHDFPTQATLRCCQISKKSGRILVTGDREKQVQLFNITTGPGGSQGKGGSAAVLSLTGHASAVESVCLDWSEEIVVGGAASGVIKLWDLEHAKVIRTLLGHKESTKALEFHPFGEFFASGSQSCDIKIWDVRRKGCIQTYTGHEGPIQVLRISPDGRWIVSGDTCGAIKLWDLTKGKLLASWSSAHENQPIADLEFSPSEYLLASLSTDGRICLFDLQSFEGVGSLQLSSIPGLSKLGFGNGDSVIAKSLKFHPEGRYMCVGCEGSCCIVQVDPVKVLDVISVPWPGIADLFVHPGGWTVGSALDQNFIGVWRVDTGPKDQHPVSDLGQMKPSNGTPPESTSNPVIAPKPKSVLPAIPIQGTISLTSLPSVSDLPDNDIKPRASSVESLPRIFSDLRVNSVSAGGSASSSTNDLFLPTRSGNTSVEELGSVKSSRSTDQALVPHPPTSAPPPAETGRPSVLMKSSSKESVLRTDVSALSELDRKSTAQTFPVVGTTAAISSSERTVQSKETFKTYPAINGDIPLQLDFSRFMGRGVTAPLHCASSAHPISPLTPESERRVLETLSTDNTTILSILHSRIQSLSAIRQVWTPDTTIQPALQACVRLRDDAITIDIIRLLLQKPKLVNLASCGVLLHLLQEVLVVGYADYITSACTMIQLLIKSFRVLLLDTLTNARAGGGLLNGNGGVDLVMEERVQKCKTCWLGLLRVRSTLQQLPQQYDVMVRGALEALTVLDEMKG